jgi:uncharacterized protein YecE (DUF72 family)
MDLPLLDAFLTLLPRGPRFAFEFRHESGDTEEVRATLGKHEVAWCVADEDDRDAPLVRTAPGFVYLRLRKGVYDDRALAHWAKEIEETLAGGADVYCYFKHEDEGRGVQFAQTLARMIGATSEPAHAPEEPASASVSASVPSPGRSSTGTAPAP